MLVRVPQEYHPELVVLEASDAVRLVHEAGTPFPQGRIGKIEIGDAIVDEADPGLTLPGCGWLSISRTPPH